MNEIEQRPTYSALLKIGAVRHLGFQDSWVSTIPRSPGTYKEPSHQISAKIPLFVAELFWELIWGKFISPSSRS